MLKFKIKFPDEKKSELQAALDLLMANKEFTDYVTEAVTNREDAARSTAESERDQARNQLKEFRDNNTELKSQLEKFAKIDLDEYSRLKKMGGTAEQQAEALRAAELEHEGIVKGLNETITKNKTTIEELETKVTENQFEFDTRNAIGEYLAENPNIPLAGAGADQILIEKARASRRMIGDKQVLTRADGKEFTTDNGIGSIAEWIGSEARKQWPFLFKSEGGSGAPGDDGGSGGSGKQRMSRGDFDAIKDPARKAEVAQTHEITE